MIITINTAAVFGTRGGSNFSIARSGKFTSQYPSEHRDGKRKRADAVQSMPNAAIAFMTRSLSRA